MTYNYNTFVNRNVFYVYKLGVYVFYDITTTSYLVYDIETNEHILSYPKPKKGMKLVDFIRQLENGTISLYN